MDPSMFVTYTPQTNGVPSESKLATYMVIHLFFCINGYKIVLDNYSVSSYTESPKSWHRLEYKLDDQAFVQPFSGFTKESNCQSRICARKRPYGQQQQLTKSLQQLLHPFARKRRWHYVLLFREYQQRRCRSRGWH